ncbi:MAG: glycosyltransferase family 2 protein [Candidatus Thermoplasmatota archaeon]
MRDTLLSKEREKMLDTLLSAPAPNHNFIVVLNQFIIVKPKVSIIILNWNGMAYLEECLKSVFDLEYKNFEVILVDNASTDCSVDLVKEKFPQVKIIVNEENFGFAKGNNIGIKSAGGEYIVLLNNDTKVDKKWLSELVRVADENENVGMCASKMLFYAQPDTINSTGMQIWISGGTSDRGFGKKDIGQFDSLEDVIGPCAGAALYKKNMLDYIGFFDEDYFMYFEDTDLALRGLFQGWKCKFVPSAIVYHKYQASAKKVKNEVVYYYMVRNSWYNVFKFFPCGTLPLTIMYKLVGDIFYIFYHKEKYNMKTYGKALYDAFVCLPRLIKERKKIYRRKKIKDFEFIRWLFKKRM